MIPVTVAWKSSGDAYKIEGTIVDSTQRNNRQLLTIKTDDSDGYFAKDGIFYSDPGGRYSITKKNEKQAERFGFLDTTSDENYNQRTKPMTPDEIDRAIKVKLNELLLSNLPYHIDTYVKHGNDVNARAKITETIDFWETYDKEVTLYRGQKRNQEIRTRPQYFFSTSSELSVAARYDFFDPNEMCCLFIIHVQPGVKHYDIPNESTRDYEYEVLLEGNGVFYTHKDRRSRGFRQLTLEEAINEHKLQVLGNDDPTPEELPQPTGVFEAYYFPPATGGSRKRRKTYKKKNRKRQTRRRI